MSTVESSGRVLVGSRLRYVLLLLIGLIFVAAGTAMVGSGKPLGWAAIVFFGSGVVVTAIAAIRPPRLELTATGFHLRQVLNRQRLSLEWTQCSEFQVHRMTMTNSAIVFENERPDHQVMQSMSRALAGRNSGIQANYRGITPAELAELMNAYRARAVAGSS